MSAYLNIGCGSRRHPAWENLDVAPADRSVLAWDVRKGLPHPDHCFDVVYHSHILEHLPRAGAVPFLKEVARVLRPGGIVRTVVPDLEAIARLYLQSLERSLAGDAVWQKRYDWILLELYDQTVRERSGGDMAEYLRQDLMPERDFVRERLGREARRFMAEESVEGAPVEGARRQRLGSSFALFGRAARHPLAALRLFAARLVLGSNYEMLQLGKFRRAGEVHLWMYDRYSLGRLLEASGFVHSTVVGAAESAIPAWEGFHLDSEPDGSVSKPDSLFMEARKP